MSDAVIRLNKALEGRYRIERELGEGGMATVYVADDVRHERRVALKVLKPELAAVVGAGRFLAEIKTTANLHHPHILPLFDSGEADGFLYYVMPYVEGESLRQRLARDKQLSIAESVRIGTAVAGALDYAHRHGIVHRDIKPANILIQDGQPVVSDFGIALALGAGGGARLTETGLSVGTPYYMSPEQATGDQHIGPASDIFSLGCVIYEMLVGEPPYQGSTAQAVLGRIIAGEPVSPSAARESVPIHVDAAIRRAIERVPADRFGGAADFARALADPGFRHGAPAGVSGTPSRSWKALAIAMGLLATVSTGLVVSMFVWRDRPAPVIRYELTFPAGEAPTSGAGATGPSFAFSDDGSSMAYVGPSAERAYQIWVRERNEETGRPIDGSGRGVQPFFSPDGRRVGFIQSLTDELRVVSLEGGPPLTLVGTGVERLGAAWGPDGYVYYVAADTYGLYRVPARGGDVEEVALARPEDRVAAYAWPEVLPGGGGVLVTVLRQLGSYSSGDDVGVIDLETGRLDILVHGVLGRYLPTGHLVYVTHEGSLVAARFDEDALRITGPTVPLASGLPQRVWGPDMALSRSGRLVYQTIPEARRQELVWVDRSGGVAPVEPGWTFVPDLTGQQPTLSPGDRRIALGLIPDRGPLELWVKQIDGPRSRLPLDGLAGRPTWSPDGEAVVFVSDILSLYDVWTRRADGGGEPELLVDVEDPIGEVRWAPDGTWLLLRTSATAGRGDILAFSPAHDAAPRPLVATEFIESAPALSPDGRFLAYVSDASGGLEVLVRPYPGLDAITQVSADGGVEPLWSHSGQELFYRNRADELVAVRVDTREEFRILGRETLFTLPPGPRGTPWALQYDVTEDGQRFLMFRYVDGESQPRQDQYHVVENFDQELLRRVES